MSVILNKIKKEAKIRCPLCDKEYLATNLKMIDQDEETITAHSNCPNCDGAVMSLLYRDQNGVTLFGLVTDLNYQDALRVKTLAKIEDDDILNFYQDLKTNKK